MYYIGQALWASNKEKEGPVIYDGCCVSKTGKHTHFFHWLDGEVMRLGNVKVDSHDVLLMGITNVKTGRLFKGKYCKGTFVGELVSEDDEAAYDSKVEQIKSYLIELKTKANNGQLRANRSADKAHSNVEGATEEVGE